MCYFCTFVGPTGVAQLKNGTNKPTAPSAVLQACIHCRDDGKKRRNRRLPSNSKCDRGPWALQAANTAALHSKKAPFDCEITTARRVSTLHA